MGSLKHIVLPDYRAKGQPYRTDYRAGNCDHRPDYRSYYEKKRHFLGPIIGPYLDKPSVWPKSKCIYREESARGPPKGFVTSQQVFLYPT